MVVASYNFLIEFGIWKGRIGFLHLSLSPYNRVLDQDKTLSPGRIAWVKLKQHNKTDSIKYVVLAYENSEAVGCGAIKEWNSETMEVKRMFVPLKNRGKGIASFVLKELEHWAKELGYKKCILETGEKQPEAIQLYTKNNYNLIPNYGQYAGVEASKCFEKYLS